MNDQNNDRQATDNSEQLRRTTIPNGTTLNVNGLLVTLCSDVEIEANASVIDRIGEDLRLYTGASQK